MFLQTLLLLLVACCFLPSSAITCFNGSEPINMGNSTNLLTTQRQIAGANFTDICYVFREHYCDNCTTPDLYTFGYGTDPPMIVTNNSICTAINASRCIVDNNLNVYRHNYCCSWDYCNAPNVALQYVLDPTTYCMVSSNNWNATTTAGPVTKHGIKCNAKILVEAVFLYALITFLHSY